MAHSTYGGGLRIIIYIIIYIIHINIVIQIQFGKLGADDDEHAVCAVEEKVEVLLLMRGANDEPDAKEIGTDSKTTVTQKVFMTPICVSITELQ